MPVAPALRTDRPRGLAWILAAYGLASLAAVAVGWELRGTDALLVVAIADGVATLVVFAFSVALDNSSVYDPYWSVAPMVMVVCWWWISPATSGSMASRQALVIALLAVWGSRLTFNWARRWGGLPDEDFRYVEIRRRAGRGYWPASLVVIHLLPTAWVFLGLLPVYAAVAVPERPLGALDVLGTVVAVAAIAIESNADRALSDFRRARRDPAEVLQRGLWRWSRHPNYFGEILFWWGLFLIGLSARPGWAWTAVGPLAITLLFVLVSVPWMDRRMASRHPAWEDVLRRTSALVPWPPRSP
jgi:steroid 5-alpha reductase family enzyme